jgi:proteasome lid subunit RPN8/RPN11
LIFSPLAWLKLQLFLHAGETEVGGFAISSEHDLLYVQDFVTLEQVTTSVTVEFTDTAVANHFDNCVDAGMPPSRFARIWCHTHPGSSPEPSSVDEETFARVFGDCDWGIMFILSRTGRTYARLNFNAGPGGSTLLPLMVDWESWPQVLLDELPRLPELFEDWMSEFDRNIHPYHPPFQPPYHGIDMAPSNMADWYQWDDELYEQRIAALEPDQNALLEAGT